VKKVLAVCLPAILAACGADSEMTEQSDAQHESQIQVNVDQLAYLSLPVSAGSQHDLMPRLEAVLATALPGRFVSDDSDGAALKRTTTAAYDDIDYSVDAVFGASAGDWAALQWDKSAHYGLMGVLNETVAKRLCLLSYWTGNVDRVYEPTELQRTIGVTAADLSGKAGQAIQAFCPAMTDADLAMLSSAAPIQIWYEVTDFSVQAGSQYETVLRYQIAGTANGGQDGFSVSGQFFHTISTQRLKFVLSEQSDSQDSLYVAVDAGPGMVLLEGQRMTGDDPARRQTIYRLRLDEQKNEAAALVHAHERAGYPATDLAVLMTFGAQPVGEVAVSIGADGIDSLRDVFACANRDSLRLVAEAGSSGVCDGAMSATLSPWFDNGRALVSSDQMDIAAIDEKSIVNFDSLEQMLLSAPLTAAASIRRSDEVNQLLPR